MKVINQVLLAGGSGTRLWPLSQNSYPKQLSRVIRDISLFQLNAKQLISSAIIAFAPQIISTDADLRFVIGKQL